MTARQREILSGIGQRIKRRRLERGMPQNTLASLIGVEKSNMSRLEAGRSNATIGTLLKVADALEISFVELFQD